MKVVSLLPSATEIVFALGLGDSLVGVTDECDFPPEAVTKPVVSRSALPQGRPLSAREIDQAVRGKLDAEEPLYVLDTDLLRREQPDVVLTQDLCRVCAVPSGQVQRALEKLGLPDAKVLSLDPNTLEDVIAQIDVVGKLLERPEEAAKLTDSLRMRVAKVKEVATRLPMLNVFCLEWSDPPFAAGHWVPEMVEAVAGVNLLSEKAGPSRSSRTVEDQQCRIRRQWSSCHAATTSRRRRRRRPRFTHPELRRHRRSATATSSPWIDLLLLAAGASDRRRARVAPTGRFAGRLPGPAGRQHLPGQLSRLSRVTRYPRAMAARNLVTPHDLGKRVSFQFELPNGYVGEAVGVLERWDEDAETYFVRKKDGTEVRVPARGIRYGEVE